MQIETITFKLKSGKEITLTPEELDELGQYVKPPALPYVSPYAVHTKPLNWSTIDVDWTVRPNHTTWCSTGGDLVCRM